MSSNESPHNAELVSGISAGAVVSAGASKIPPSPPPPPAIPENTSLLSVGVGAARSQKELRLRLVQAIETEDLVAVTRLLAGGVRLDCVIIFNKTPLTYAVELQALDIVRALVAAGADLSGQEPIATARQSLHIAAALYSPDILEFLLEHGAPVDGRDGCGATPLMMAALAGNLTAVKLLIGCGADVTAADAVGKTALHRAAEGEHEDIIDILLAEGAELNARDQFGWTALYHSIVFCHMDTLGSLLSRGIDVNGTDCNGQSPLILTCRRLSAHNVKIVLSTSLDFHSRQRRIPTPALHALVNQGDNEWFDFAILAALINAGARLNSGAGTLTALLAGCPGLTLRPTLVHYLLATGCVWESDPQAVPADFPQAQPWLKGQMSLHQQCRRALRTHLSAVSVSCEGNVCNIKKTVADLPLPLTLRNFLNMSDFFDLNPYFLQFA